jgi:3-phenylpropionate/trans-cinnamate dioxygenase ferredoxin reductase subunit
LSKKFLSGELSAERLHIKPQSFYDDARIHARLETRVSEINRSTKTIVTQSGETFAYDTLILATGSRVRRLPIEGDNLKGVHYLRNIADVEGIRSELHSRSRLSKWKIG